ncbi:MAG: DUF2892 domain-containing protein [Chloroflexota bacterium]|nr:DUF2892 domain-containing protein [Chloroflexota bacterium]
MCPFIVRNVSDTERLIRAVLGVFGMLLGFLFIQGPWGMLLGILGVVSLVTGAIGWCGVYLLLEKELPVDDKSSEE